MAFVAIFILNIIYHFIQLLDVSDFAKDDFDRNGVLDFLGAISDYEDKMNISLREEKSLVQKEEGIELDETSKQEDEYAGGLSQPDLLDDYVDYERGDYSNANNVQTNSNHSEILEAEENQANSDLLQSVLEEVTTAVLVFPTNDTGVDFYAFVDDAIGGDLDDNGFFGPESDKPDTEVLEGHVSSSQTIGDKLIEIPVENVRGNNDVEESFDVEGAKGVMTEGPIKNMKKIEFSEAIQTDPMETNVFVPKLQTTQPRAELTEVQREKVVTPTLQNVEPQITVNSRRDLTVVPFPRHINAPRFVGDDTTISVQLDGRTLISCSATGKPRPNCQWKMQGKVITRNSSQYCSINISFTEFADGNVLQYPFHSWKFQVLNARLMMIKKVEESDAGTITVTATNPYGTTSRDMQLEGIN